MKYTVTKNGITVTANIKQQPRTLPLLHAVQALKSIGISQSDAFRIISEHINRD